MKISKVEKDVKGGLKVVLEGQRLLDIVKDCKQAGAELGQAQLMLGLYFHQI